MSSSLSFRRFAAAACVVGSALGAPALAAAGSVPVSSVTGTLTAVGSSTFTVQTSGKQVGVIAALTAAANKVTKGDYPYVWGGGHAVAGVASVGIKGGPGANGKRVGFDCSGSVAAVLAGAGLWPAGASVPSDAGVISELRSAGIIAPGAGTGASEVTLYDDPGVHIFMNIDGRFFGTSDGYGGNSTQKNGGAGWLDDSAPDAHSRIYKQYHVVPSVLKARRSDGYNYTFQDGAVAALLPAFPVGRKVAVTYTSTGGTLTATSVSLPNSITTTGTVTAISPTAGTVTLQTAPGTTLTLQVGTDTSLLSGLLVGDTVEATYTKSGARLTLHSVAVTAQAVTPPPSSGGTESPDGGAGYSGGGGGTGGSGSGGGGY
jgi:Cu/Ag efflux protein CusF